MNEIAYALFATGGGLGAVLRHALGRLVAHRTPPATPLAAPLATLLVNVLGSAVLGAALGWTAEAESVAGDGLRRLVVGFTGGFTTFSSFAVQSLELGRTRSARALLSNVAANLGLCLAAFWFAAQAVAS